MPARIRDVFNVPTPGRTELRKLLRKDDLASWNTAWRDILRVYRPMLVAKARLRGLKSADAEEIADEIIANMARRPQLFVERQEGVGLRQYLFRCVNNAIVNFHRRQARPGGVLAAGGDEGHSRLMAQADPRFQRELAEELTETVNQNSGRVATALERVKLKCRKPHRFEAFWLHCVGGYPASEVARMLGITPAAVTQATYFITNRVKAALKMTPGSPRKSKIRTRS